VLDPPDPTRCNFGWLCSSRIRRLPCRPSGRIAGRLLYPVPRPARLTRCDKESGPDTGCHVHLREQRGNHAVASPGMATAVAGGLPGESRVARKPRPRRGSGRMGWQGVWMPSLLDEQLPLVSPTACRSDVTYRHVAGVRRGLGSSARSSTRVVHEAVTDKSQSARRRPAVPRAACKAKEAKGLTAESLLSKKRARAAARGPCVLAV
jgi:hypothetical protein